MDKKISPTILDSLAFLLLSVALFCYSLYRHYNGLPVEWQMSPYLFPALLSVFLFLLSLSLFAEGRRQSTSRGKTDSTAKKAADYRGVLVTIAASVLYVALMPVIHFLPATVLFLAGMLCYLGERRRWLVGLLSVGTSVAIYVLFALMLNVMLP